MKFHLQACTQACGPPLRFTAFEGFHLQQGIFCPKVGKSSAIHQPVGDCRVKEANCISEQLSEISSQLQHLDAYRMVQLLRKGGIEYRAPFEGNSCSHLSSPTCRNVGQARSPLSPPKRCVAPPGLKEPRSKGRLPPTRFVSKLTPSKRLQNLFRSVAAANGHSKLSGGADALTAVKRINPCSLVTRCMAPCFGVSDPQHAKTNSAWKGQVTALGHQHLSNPKDSTPG